MCVDEVSSLLLHHSFVEPNLDASLDSKTVSIRHPSTFPVVLLYYCNAASADLYHHLKLVGAYVVNITASCVYALKSALAHFTYQNFHSFPL